ncbi:alpha/beta fold hydrolase, partial [Streptomyces sp. SID161]
MVNPCRLRAAALTTTALLSAVLAGCGGRAENGDLTAQQLDWQDCPAPSEAEGGGSAPSPLPSGGEWQCATMKAPLDWSRPKGDTIGIALIRARASGPEERRLGSLVFNFGGPGGSGVITLPSFAADYAALRTRYDLVSFDPRGVGRSAPVQCESNSQLDVYFQQDATPDDKAERARFLERTKRFNAACEKNSKKILPHVRTTDAARDMDLMRQVLG